MSFAARLVSDFVITSYVLRQRHGIKVNPPLVTCVMLMISKMKGMSLSTASIPTVFLFEGYMISGSPNRSPRCVYMFESGKHHCIFSSMNYLLLISRLAVC
jgi:hypothetical protein